MMKLQIQEGRSEEQGVKDQICEMALRFSSVSL